MTTDATTAQRPRIGKITLFAYALIAPCVLLIVGLVAYPFLFAIYVSFTSRVIGNPGEWVGFANFAYIAQTASFQAAIWNTVLIVVVTSVLKLGLGLGLALLVNQKIPGRGIIRVILMLPWAMPAFVAFLTWRVLYQPVGGGINLLLTQTGIYPHIVDWLGQRSTAMFSVIIASVWRGFPFWFISISRRSSPSPVISTRRPASMAPMPGNASAQLPGPASCPSSSSRPSSRPSRRPMPSNMSGC